MLLVVVAPAAARPVAEPRADESGCRELELGPAPESATRLNELSPSARQPVLDVALGDDERKEELPQ